MHETEIKSGFTLNRRKEGDIGKGRERQVVTAPVSKTLLKSIHHRFIVLAETMSLLLGWRPSEAIASRLESLKVPVGAPGLPPVTVLTEMSPASDDVPQD